MSKQFGVSTKKTLCWMSGNTFWHQASIFCLFSTLSQIETKKRQELNALNQSEVKDKNTQVQQRKIDKNTENRISSGRLPPPLSLGTPLIHVYLYW